MLLLLIIALCASPICGTFIPKDHYFLRCGASSNSAGDVSYDGRVWYTDDNHTFSSSFSSTVAAAISANPDPSAAHQIPFNAARIFKSNFTYTFPVSPGPKFLRLHFRPAVYSNQFDASRFFVSVQANDRVLLRNFSAQLAVEYFKEAYVSKEYHLTVPDDRRSLDLTFSPTPPGSYAFVNGIEVVSVPDGLYISNKTLENVELGTNRFQISNSAALETAYRLNVGGIGTESAPADGKISGMYRLWKEDDPYVYLIPGQSEVTWFPIKYTEEVPDYTAPDFVYQTERSLGINPVSNVKLNLTWRFKVDPSFYYMVRLHWCELESHINTTEDRIFEVYINNLTAEIDANVMIWTNNMRNVPFYKDYVVYITGGDGDGGSADLWIALHPSTQFQATYNDVLLNGLEIFKISKSDGSLDAPNPDVPLHQTPNSPIPNQPKKTHVTLFIIGGTVAGIIVITVLLLLLLIFRHVAKNHSSTHVTSTSKSKSWFFPSSTSSQLSSTLPSHLCRRFSLREIRLATRDFNEALIIGHGGFGDVYKGVIDVENGPDFMSVAIKRLNASSSKQGLKEFVTEIEMLSTLRHVHLVSLIGFCNDDGEMILVYEYMARGSLRDHLYNTGNPPLTWSQRLNACLGAAKGLNHLHSGASTMIIHRDVKSTNILLDEKWVAKVSDFGLSKVGPTGGGDISHVSTVVKGSIGYVDIEYYKSQRLTEKSDVYSFGVVLFEVLCGRAAVDPGLSKEQVSLVKWARAHQRNGSLESIVDPRIKEEVAPACLRKFGELAESCVRDSGSNRPSMADVVWSLEFVIGLQEKAQAFSSWSGDNDVSESDAVAKEVTTSKISGNSGEFSSALEECRTTASDSSALLNTSSFEEVGEYAVSRSAVFSEIFKPKGR